MSQILPLTSDFGAKNYTIAIIKSILYNEAPSLKTINISHNVPAFDLQQSCYFIKASYPHFPDGTIHFIGVDRTEKAMGMLMALFNDVGFLQIAIYGSNLQKTGGASTLLGLSTNSNIEILFDL